MKPKPEQIKEVLDHWNSKKVRGNRWKGCRTNGDVPFDITEAIKPALVHYSLEQVKKAIDNFALVLLNNDYYWTYAWRIGTFFTVKKDGVHKWYRFLPHNFHESDYLKPGVAEYRRMKRREPVKASVRHDTKIKPLYQKFLKSKSVPALPPKRGAAQKSELKKLNGE